MMDLILDILPGLPTSLSLTFSALIVAFILAILFTLILSLKTPWFLKQLKSISRFSPVRLYWCSSS